MKSTTSVLIEKADGTREPFVRAKLENSLRKAGANPHSIETITNHIEGELKDGTPSGAIYRHAFELLRKSELVAASRYSMKRAVFELGPTGFPFEDFLAEIFRAKGWNGLTRQVLRGKCVTHEVDLLAEKGGVVIGAEAKFHNELGIKSDLKIALYVESRHQDLRDRPIEVFGGKSISEYWLITNTKFTSEAIEYGRCAGLSLISWNYPVKGNLQNLIEETAIFPITALGSLSRAERNRLIGNGVVLCRDVLRRPERLEELGFKGRKLASVVGEARALCNISHHVE